MSPSFETVKVAAVQATPVVLDAEASVEKACRLLGEAAEQGARLAVLPEAFVPLYPSGAWAHDAGAFSGWGRLWQRLWENSVDVPGPLCERIAEQLAGWGALLEVVSPDEVCAELARIGRELVTRYAATA